MKFIIKIMILILRAINIRTIKIDERKLRGHLIIVCLRLFPEFVTYFLPRAHQLPRPNERIKKTSNMLDDYVIVDDGGFHADEVNLIMRGDSFDLDTTNIRKNVYFVNPIIMKDRKKSDLEYYGSIRASSKKYKAERILYKPNFPITYVSAGNKVLEYIKNNIPILYVEEILNINGAIVRTDPIDLRNKVKEYCASREDSHVIKLYHKSGCTTLNAGSGLIATLALAKLTKQLNVYGWDYHLEFSPAFLSGYKLFRMLFNEKMYKAHKHRMYGMGLIHLLYLSRFKELDNVNIIGGYVSDINYNLRLIKNISRIFYSKHGHISIESHMKFA